LSRAVKGGHIGPLKRSARSRALTLSFDRLPTLDEMAEANLDRLLSNGERSRSDIAQATGVSERNLRRMLRDQRGTTPRPASEARAQAKSADAADRRAKRAKGHAIAGPRSDFTIPAIARRIRLAGRLKTCKYSRQSGTRSGNPGWAIGGWNMLRIRGFALAFGGLLLGAMASGSFAPAQTFSTQLPPGCVSPVNASITMGQSFHGVKCNYPSCVCAGYQCASVLCARLQAGKCVSVRKITTYKYVNCQMTPQ